MNDVELAASTLNSGGIVAHATEGVWGLCCDPRNIKSVQKILKIKQRPKNKGLILIGGSVAFFDLELSTLGLDKRKEIEECWPGHHTWVLPNTNNYSVCVTGGRDTVACRVPDHMQARSLSSQFGGPIVSSSANFSGAPELKTEQDVRREFLSIVDFILPGTIGNASGPSAIHTLEGSLLRGSRG